MARPLSRRVLARHIAGELVAGVSVSAIAEQLAAYLILHKKTNDAATILRDVSHYLAEAGHVEVVASVAHELSKAAEASLVGAAKAMTGAKDVSLAVTVDPSLIGGVKMQTPGHELNATVAYQLQTLKTRYRKA